MLEILKEKNKGKIVIIKLGAFYIATEEDAVFLHKKMDLKCNCFKNNIRTKEEAKQILEKIKEYLKNVLYLELNQKTQIFKNRQGVNFCGYKINEYRLKIRDRRKKKIKK